MYQLFVGILLSNLQVIIPSLCVLQIQTNVHNVVSRPDTPPLRKHHTPRSMNVMPERKSHLPEYAAMTTASSSSASDEMIPWKDGNEFDSDLYDMVEVEVSGSDDSGTENCSENVGVKPSTQPDSPGCYRKTNLPEESETSSGVSSWSGYERKKDDILKSFNQVHIEDRSLHPENFLEAKGFSPATRRRLNCSPISSTSSAPSLSPATARKVRDDDSWISRSSPRR